MDFPVTETFALTAAVPRLHDEARGSKQIWPASFVQLEDGSWVYRVDREDIVASEVRVALDAHDPTPTAEEARPGLVQQQLTSAIASMKTELNNWPTDLAPGATLNQVGARVNLMAAQEQRNTERLYWLAQKLLNQFE